MNDLSFKDWMKFQKSFFRYPGPQTLVEECILFFTKAVWPDGGASKSLVAGFSEFETDAIQAPRIVDRLVQHKSLSDLVDGLERTARIGERYDFILIDLRPYLRDTQDLNVFLNSYSDRMFRVLRQQLIPLRYCGMVVGMPGRGGGGFPLPWSVALSCRGHLRLRDEKIGLVEDDGSIFYCLFMQAQDDCRPASLFQPSNIAIGASDISIPPWLIPKPPPRKKNEVLHPAKFPETLVSEFIRLFTKTGDNVFDPMVGTGSAVVAAVVEGRNGYGVDLSPQYVQIARRRVEDYCQPQLSEEFRKPAATLIAEGDAAYLERITELAGVPLHYVVTSPPYWSMLTNPGSENQEARRQKHLPLVYSEDHRDLGNVKDYEQFLEKLASIYGRIAPMIVAGGRLTVVVKNIKRNHVLYPLAWDLTARLCAPEGKYEYIGTTLWCQDDVNIKPFAVGIHWVSNILHQYCVHFRKR